MGCKELILQPKLGEIMDVGMWFCAPLLVRLCSSLGLVRNHVVLILGNKGGGPHHVQGHHTWDLEIDLKLLVVLTLNIHKIFH
jgi:hypothetical protein